VRPPPRLAPRNNFGPPVRPAGDPPRLSPRPDILARMIADAQVVLAGAPFFQIFVGMGTSGTWPIAGIAEGCGKRFSVLRTDLDRAYHKDGRPRDEVTPPFTCGLPTGEWVWFDDHLASGAQLRLAYTIIKRDFPTARFMGSYLYFTPGFISAADLRARYHLDDVQPGETQEVPKP